MLAELDKARAAGTVSALNAFVTKYPDHKVLPELKAARHALYAQALDAWKKTAHVDASTAVFVDHLLAWAEKNGPEADVCFRLKPSKTMDDADKSIKKDAHYPGSDALPSRYLTADALHPREQRVAQALADRFATAFPADILGLHPAPPLDADAPAPTKVPTLTIDYAPEWSRGNTLSQKPPTVFAGFIFAFDGVFSLPEGAPLKTYAKSWRGAELWKMKGGDTMTREDFEQKVYDAMIDGSFDQLGKKLADVFF